MLFNNQDVNGLLLRGLSSCFSLVAKRRIKKSSPKTAHYFDGSALSLHRPIPTHHAAVEVHDFFEAHLQHHIAAVA